LRENLSNLLLDAQRLARNNIEQFEKYKALTLKTIEGVLIMREIIFA